MAVNAWRGVGFSIGCLFARDTVCLHSTGALHNRVGIHRERRVETAMLMPHQGGGTPFIDPKIGHFRRIDPFGLLSLITQCRWHARNGPARPGNLQAHRTKAK